MIIAKRPRRYAHGLLEPFASKLETEMLMLTRVLIRTKFSEFTIPPPIRICNVHCSQLCNTLHKWRFPRIASSDSPIADTKKLLSMPIPRHSFRWTPECMSHSIREWNANIIAVYNRPKLGLNVIAWSHYRSDPVQVQSTCRLGTLQLSTNCVQDTHMLLTRFCPRRLTIK